jgi:hypothetical protein
MVVVRKTPKGRTTVVPLPLLPLLPLPPARRTESCDPYDEASAVTVDSATRASG